MSAATTPSLDEEALPPEVIADPAALHLGALGPVGEKVEDVERIAVLRANGIGDFVVAVPALEALRAAYPGARITFLGLPWHAELLDGRPGPWDEVDVVPPYPDMVAGGVGGREPHRGLLRAAPGERSTTWRSSSTAAAATPTRSWSGSAPGSRPAPATPNLGAPALDRWVTYAYYQHEVLRFLEVVGLVGAPPVTLEPRLALTAADVRHAGRRPAGHRPAAGRACTPARPTRGAAGPPTRSPRSRRRSPNRGAEWPSWVTGRTTPEPPPRSPRPQRRVDLVGSLDMKALVGVLAPAPGSSSPTTPGPRHVAAALGTPTVGVYWVGQRHQRRSPAEGAAPDRRDLPADLPRLRRQPGEHRHGAVPPRRLVRRGRHRRGGPEALARPARRPVTQSTSSGLIRDTLQIRNRRAARLLSRRDPASQATSTVTSSATAAMSPP